MQVLQSVSMGFDGIFALFPEYVKHVGEPAINFRNLTYYSTFANAYVTYSLLFLLEMIELIHELKNEVGCRCLWPLAPG